MPQAVAKARGSWLYKARQKAGVAEPETLKIAPAPPIELDADALECWNDVAPRLVSMGVLADGDRRALSRYCKIWSRWIKACEFLDKFGEFRAIKDDDGKPTGEIEEWPQVKRSLDYDQSLRRLEQEFGLTPSARTRVRVEKKPAESATAKYLKIKGA